MTTLADGQALLCGRQVSEQPGCQGTRCRFIPPAGTLRYGPATDRWKADVPPTTPRVGHRVALLSDGRVLVAGAARQGATTAEVYTPPPAR